MHRHDLPPEESPSAGKHGPQWASQEMLQVSVLALQESMSAILKGSTPGHFEESPPWDIKWEPEGGKFSVLKRPFEANNEGDDAGHIGYKKIPGHMKFKPDQQCHKDQISHIPLALHLSS